MSSVFFPWVAEFFVRVTNPTGSDVVFELASLADAHASLDVNVDGNSLTLALPFTAIESAAGISVLQPPVLVSRPGVYPTGLAGGESISVNGATITFPPDGPWQPFSDELGPEVIAQYFSQARVLTTLAKAGGSVFSAEDAAPSVRSVARRIVLTGLAEGPGASLAITAVSSPAVTTALGFAVGDVAYGTSSLAGGPFTRRAVVPAGASFVLSDPHPVIDPSSVSTGAVVVPSPLTATVLSPVVSPRIRQVRDPLIVGNSTDGVHEVT